MSLVDDIIASTDAKREGASFRGACPSCGAKNLTFKPSSDPEGWPVFSTWSCDCADPDSNAPDRALRVIEALEAKGILAATTTNRRSSQEPEKAPRPSKRETNARRPPRTKPTKTYYYTDPVSGQRLAKTRYDFTNAKGEPDKDFEWTSGAPARGLVYNLGKLKEAPKSPVFWVEGEKKADALTEIGALAVCGGCGSGSDPLPVALEAFRGRVVFIWPDADSKGWKHAREMAGRLYGIASEVFFVEWAEAKPSEDAYDFLAQYATRDEKVKAVRGLLAKRRLAPIPAPRFAESYEAFDARVARMDATPRWLLVDLIPDVGVVLFHGQPRSFKTMSDKVVVMSLASGVGVIGAVPQRKRVLWLNEEDSEIATRDSIKALRRGVERTLPEGQRLDLSTLFLKCRTGINIEARDGQSELLAMIEEIRPEILVLDPIRSYWPKVDASPSEAALGKLFLMSLLRETSITTILIVAHDVKRSREGIDTRTRPELVSGGVLFSMAEAPISFERVGNSTVTNVRPAMFKGAPTPAGFTLNFDLRIEGEGASRRLAEATVSKTEADEDAMRVSADARTVVEKMPKDGREIKRSEFTGGRGSQANQKAISRLGAAGVLGERSGDPSRTDPDTGKPESKQSVYLRLLVPIEEARRVAAQTGAIGGDSDGDFVTEAAPHLLPAGDLGAAEPASNVMQCAPLDDGFEAQLTKAEEAAVDGRGGPRAMNLFTDEDRRILTEIAATFRDPVTGEPAKVAGLRCAVVDGEHEQPHPEESCRRRERRRDGDLEGRSTLEGEAVNS